MSVSKIPIPQIIKIGVLIGAQGCNLKPIAEKTSTSIHVNTKVNPALIEIRINWDYNSSSLPPSENGINKARDQLNILINKLLKQLKNLKDLKNFREPKDFKDLKDLNDLKNFKDLECLKEFKVPESLKEFKEFECLKEFQGFRLG
ncbi:7110_t:CDS:2, partial [Funneliformis geosporum]